VGKSTLLNALARSRIAIVEHTPGVTRDRVEVLCTVADRTVRLVDTGGIGIVDRAGLAGEVERQVGEAIAAADVILFVADAREGRTPLDERVAALLRRASGRVLLLANKAEASGLEANLAELEALGHGTPHPISAKERIGLAELEETLDGLLPEGPTTPVRIAPPALQLAVVGRVNAGKSSLVNALLQDERMIVSEVPGTTRDTVDVRFDWAGAKDGEQRAVVLIDTAGIRKEKSVQGSIDWYAQRRAERAMRRADVTALVLDATADVASLDRRIAAYAVARHHPVVVVANKWDLRPHGFKQETFRKYLHETLPGLRFAPVVFTSATRGQGVDDVLERAVRLHAEANRRIPTAAVNRILAEAEARRAPRPSHGRVGHVFYGTQVRVGPPTFALFVNDPALFEGAWLRYLENRFREAGPFSSVPLKFVLRARARAPAER
jgi:GTP-binding protein